MTEIHDALDDCLEAMARGASADNAVKRFPKLAHELRPLLEASLMAKDVARIHVPLDVRRRGRSHLLQQVRAINESSVPARRRMIPFFPRVALTSGLVAALVLTSTGLVSASSSSLPGQQLYPVKRTWESVRLLFAFSPEQRDLIESNYEQERLNETHDLLGQRLTAPITFSGVLAKQTDGKWLISGIPVSVNSTTSLPTLRIADGAPVSVTGVTRADGVVEAQQIQVLQPGASLPPLEPSENNEQDSQGSTEGGGGISATPVASPTAGATQLGPASPESEQTTYQFSGVVQSMQGNLWRINGQPVYVDAAQIGGQVGIGSMVRFQGYYNADGNFTVTSIEPQTRNSAGNHGGSGGSGGSDGGGEGGGGGEPEGGDGP
jgi:hypothetical protein